MVAIKEVDMQNVFDVCDLTTNKDGVGTVMEEYLCCNAVSVAESKFDLTMHPKALYADDTLIGFFMYRHTEEDAGTATICRFMIDHAFQGKGLGRQALHCILEYLKAQGIQTVVLMIDDANKIAKSLYLSFGFSFTGKIDKGEYYYQLKL